MIDTDISSLFDIKMFFCAAYFPLPTSGGTFCSWSFELVCCVSVLFVMLTLEELVPIMVELFFKFDFIVQFCHDWKLQ